MRAAGADAIVDLSVPDLHESLRQQVFALTGKKGVDIIVDMLGGDISTPRYARSPGAGG